MANFTLATKQPGNVRRTGGLKASPLSLKGGSLLTAQINTNAARIDYTPSNVPKAVQDQTSAGIQHFMGTLAESAFKYQERESSYWADTAVMTYSALAEKGLNGSLDAEGNYIPGFKDVDGADAIAGFETYNAKLEDAFMASMQNLDPRTQQKAIFRMQATKQEFRKQAAGHRATQMNKAEVENRYKEAKHKGVIFRSDPTQISRSTLPKGVGGLPGPTGKQLYYNLFDSQEEADKSWYTLMDGITKDTYFMEINKGLDKDGISGHDRGMAKARKFFTDYAGPELEGDPTARASLANFLDTQDVSNIRQKAQVAREAARVEQVALDAKQLEGSKMVAKAISERDIPTVEEAEFMLSNDDLSIQAFDSFVRSYHSGDVLTDHATLSAIYEAIDNGEIVNESQLYTNDVSFAESRKAYDYWRNLETTPGFKHKMGRVMDSINEWLTPNYAVGSLQNKQIGSLRVAAINDARAMLLNGDTPTQIITELSEMYQLSPADLANQPPFRGVLAQPTTTPELDDIEVGLNDMELLIGTDDEIFSKAELDNERIKLIKHRRAHAVKAGAELTGIQNAFKKPGEDEAKTETEEPEVTVEELISQSAQQEIEIKRQVASAFEGDEDTINRITNEMLVKEQKKRDRKIKILEQDNEVSPRGPNPASQNRSPEAQASAEIAEDVQNTKANERRKNTRGGNVERNKASKKKLVAPNDNAGGGWF